MDFCERVEDRNSRRAGGLRKLFLCHVIDVFAPMQFLSDLVDLCLCGFHHRCSERLVVLSDLELHFGLLYFVCLIHDDRCSSFVRLFKRPRNYNVQPRLVRGGVGEK